MTHARTKNLTLCLLAAGLLAACGGGDGGDPNPLVAGTDVPQSATTTSAGATEFAAGVAGRPEDTAEPLVLGDAALATSETDEPAAI